MMTNGNEEEACNPYASRERASTTSSPRWPPCLRLQLLNQRWHGGQNFRMEPLYQMISSHWLRPDTKIELSGSPKNLGQRQKSLILRAHARLCKAFQCEVH
jgi:hypothetical protein